MVSWGVSSHFSAYFSTIAVDPARFARPAGVRFFVGAADGGDEGDHVGVVGGQRFQFGVIREFVVVARAHQDVEVVPGPALLDVLPDDADVGDDAGYGGDEQLVRLRRVEDEDSLRPGAYGDAVPVFQVVEKRGEVAVGRRNEFYEEFEVFFIRRGHYGVGALDSSRSDGAVLAGLEGEALGLFQPDSPEIVGKVFSPQYGCLGEFSDAGMFLFGWWSPS